MKKYILKPGCHQFVPGENPRHNNDNLTDAEAEWYLERYPHIAKLFVQRPTGDEDSMQIETKMTKTTSKSKRVSTLTSYLGGEEGL